MLVIFTCLKRPAPCPGPTLVVIAIHDNDNTIPNVTQIMNTSNVCCLFEIYDNSCVYASFLLLENIYELSMIHMVNLTFDFNHLTV